MKEKTNFPSALQNYDLYACSGILFNHESPLRGLEFVTRKITATLAEIKAGRKKVLELGNYYAKRDWGYAGDFIEGIWKMMQAQEPQDYVLATGEQHSVKEFADYIFSRIKMNYHSLEKPPTIH